MNAAPLVETLVTDHLDLWTAALKRKSTAGRSSSSKVELYGIKKLRELILELAVRGLLVPQDPNDEPASELLKRSAVEKAKLAKEGEIKADKPLPPIGNAEIPFDLAKGWLWERLPNISFFQEGPGIMAKDFRDAGVPLIRISGMHGPCVSLDGCNFLDEDMVAQKWNHFRLKEGDILLSSSASLGKVSKVGTDAVGSIAYTGLIRFRPFKSVFDDYLIRFLGSNEFVRQIDGSKRGAAIQHFGPTHLRGMIVPVPPIAEQHRIVAKVDELMALCDQLEQQTDASLGAHQTLVETLLSALTSAADHAQFASAWQRIAGHFDTLFTTEESIAQLKQTILQLAVMGKLVPQDPNDEPASELLKKIAAEKVKLFSAGGVKREGALPAVTDEEKPFELPSGWACERIGNLVSKLGSGSTPRGGKEVYVSEGIRFLRSQNVWNDGINLEDIAYISRETHEKMAGTRVLPGDVLLNITGASLGRSAIFPDQLVEANVSQHVTIIRLLLPEMARFVHLGVISPLIQKLVWGRQVGMAIEGLSKKVLEMFEFPIPPLAEQHRIVAKVDELMALCDQLKSRLSDAQTTQLHLADALVERAIG